MGSIWEVFLRLGCNEHPRCAPTSSPPTILALPLADDVRDELWSLQAPGARRVFRYPNGQPITAWGFAAFRRACAAAGIVNFRPHDLRHTGASRTLRRTNNLRLVQRLLTQKDIASTVKYAHF